MKVPWFGPFPEAKKVEKLLCEFIATIGPDLAHNFEPFTCLECGTHLSLSLG
jgi:hypothetical protein